MGLFIKCGRKIRLLTLFGLILLSFAGCSGGSNSQSGNSLDVGVLDVGVLFNLSDAQDNTGKDMLASVQIAKAHLEYYLKNKGSKFTKINLNIKDTKGDPAMALEELKNLKNAGIKIVMGPEKSAEASAIVSYANSNGIMLISPSSTATSLALDDNLFRFVATDKQQAEALAMLVSENKDIAAVIPIYSDDTFGQSFYDDLKTFFGPSGVSTAALLPGVPLGSDIPAAITAAEDLANGAVSDYGAGKVCVILMGLEDQSIQLLAQINEASILATLQWYGNSEITNSPKVSENASAALIARKTALTGVAFTSENDDFFVYAQNILNEVKKAVGHTPSVFALNAWDAIWCVAMTYDDIYDDIKIKSLSGDAYLTLLKDAFIKLSGKFYGATGFGHIDENTGDRIFAQYALYSYGAMGWNLSGSYKYDPNTGANISVGSTLIDKLAVSNITTIGIILPLSEQKWGDAVKAIQTAKNDINTYFSNRGLDYAVEFETLESNNDPALALQHIETFRKKGIMVVVGIPYSAELKNVETYINENNMVLISPSSTATSLAKDDNILRLMPSDKHQAGALNALLTEKGVKKLVVLNVNDTYGNDFVSELGTIYAKVSYPRGATDFSSYLTTLDTKVKDALLTNATSEIAVLFIGYPGDIKVFEQISNYSGLMSVGWYGTDAVACIPDFFSNSLARENALKVNFTASIYDYEGFMLNLPQVYSFNFMMNKSSVTTRIINLYDSLWIAAVGYYNKLADSTSTDADIIRYTKDQAQKTYGMGTPTFLDENGDRGTTAYGFYKIDDKISDWKLYATYSNAGFSPGLVIH